MTGEETPQERERLLDRCIDALLSGRSWREELSGRGATGEELELLMQVAEEFLEATRRLPPPARHRSFRIWRRIAGATAELFRFRVHARAFEIRARGRAVVAAFVAALLG
ncbi:hypothetical protein HRbin29_00834 [bacterium HR29]|jgi:cobalamin biosynthesis Mg chelatase CobN|nr:hypothetical protein HRbin29_00834 [bacterium HR29]